MASLLKYSTEFVILNSGLSGSSSVVEHNLAKVGVAGPNPVFRSILFCTGIIENGDFLVADFHFGERGGVFCC